MNISIKASAQYMRDHESSRIVNTVGKGIHNESSWILNTVLLPRD